jgi:hypothetical protein
MTTLHFGLMCCCERVADLGRKSDPDIVAQRAKNMRVSLRMFIGAFRNSELDSETNRPSSRLGQHTGCRNRNKHRLDLTSYNLTGVGPSRKRVQ